MLTTITRNWWIVLLRGLFAICFGIFALIHPVITLVALVLVFGIYALIDGISAIAIGLAGGVMGVRWWEMILVGTISVAAGVLTLFWPDVSAVALLVLIATWSMIRGMMEIIAAIRLRKLIENEWLLVLGGVLSVLFGAAVIIQPAAGALALVWVIGVYALILGVLSVALAFRLRAMNARQSHQETAPVAASH